MIIFIVEIFFGEIEKADFYFELILILEVVAYTLIIYFIYLKLKKRCSIKSREIILKVNKYFSFIW